MEKYKSLEALIRHIAEAGIVSTPGAINTGHVRSGRNNFSSQKNDGETGHSNNNGPAMKRVADQEKETKREQQISKDEMKRQIDQRKKDAEERQVELQKRVEEEEAEVPAGTKDRVKVKLVSRPDDLEPTSPKSKLARTAAYKTNVIDEEIPMNTNRFGLPASLIELAQQVIESNPDHVSNAASDAKKMTGGKTKVDLEPKTIDKLDDESGSKPSTKNVKEELSPAQKKIAAMAGDKNKIDAADFKALRSGKCSECGKKPCECMKEEVEPQEKEKNQDYFVGPWAHHMNQARIAMQKAKRAKEDAMKSKDPTDHDIAARWAHNASWHMKAASTAGRRIKEEVELSDEELENIAAIAELFDEAKKKEKTVPSQTTIGSAPTRGANQDQSGFNTSGNVADYTISDEVQYESKELANHKAALKKLLDQKASGVNLGGGSSIDNQIKNKKAVIAKMMKEESELDEARGRPRKNPKPEDPSEDEHEHPVVQLQKIITTQGTKPFTHLNGEKTTMNPQMAQYALKIYNHGLKTSADKDAFTDKLHKSHASMKAALS